MNQFEIFGKLIERIRDPAFAFFLALIVAVGVFSFFGNNPEIAWGVLGLGFVLTVVITLRDYRKDARQGVRMFIALKFPVGVDATQLRLVGCEYTVTDPRNPEAKRNGQVKPIRAGDGWICPVPDVPPGDIIDFVIKDARGRRWIIESQTPELLWPPVDVVLGL